MTDVLDADQHPDNSHEFLKKAMAPYTEAQGSYMLNTTARMNDAGRYRMQQQQQDADYISNKVPR